MLGIIIAVVLALLALWVLHTRNTLAAMNENINSAMNQLGVQLSSRFDALTALLELLRGYDAPASQALLGGLLLHRSAITAASTPGEATQQEDVIAQTLERLTSVEEAHPELRSDGRYGRYMSAVTGYGVMVRTSRLIYNDSVTKFNRALRTFPTSAVAGVLGFRQREYMEAPEVTAFGV